MSGSPHLKDQFAGLQTRPVNDSATKSSLPLSDIASHFWLNCATLAVPVPDLRKRMTTSPGV
jgi:hypothetical protein